MKLTLYTHPMSPCAQKVRLVLAEKELGWTAHVIDLAAKQNLEPWYLKLNKLGVVPTLVADDESIIESSIICEFLDDAFPATPLRPSSPHGLARMRYWMKQVDNKLHPACGTLQWPLIMRPRLMEMSPEQRAALLDQVVERERRERQKRLAEHGLDAPDVVHAVATYRQFIADLDEALLHHAWAADDYFSLADCALAPYFQTLLQFGWFAFYEHSARVTDWYARVQARTSYQTAVAADFPSETLNDLRARGARAWPQIERHLAHTQ